VRLSRYFLTFGVVVLIGLALLAGGVFLLVQRESGARVRAMVLSCTSSASRYGGAHCIGTRVSGGSLLAGGHVVTGPIDGATRDDVGKTIEVTVSGDRAYTRSLRTPIVLLVVGLGISVFMGVVIPLSLQRSRRRPRADAGAAAKVSVEEVARQIRELRSAGRLADAVALVDGLGQYGVNDEQDFDTSLGASVCAAYAQQLTASDPAGARAAYLRAAELQRAFAASATAGGEGLARMAVADTYEARAH
jgi:hypothetical protein